LINATKSELLVAAEKALVEASRSIRLHERDCKACLADKPCNEYGRLAWMIEAETRAVEVAS